MDESLGKACRSVGGKVLQLGYVFCDSCVCRDLSSSPAWAVTQAQAGGGWANPGQGVPVQGTPPPPLSRSVPSGPLPVLCLQRLCRRPSQGPALPLPVGTVAEAEADSDGAGRGRLPPSPRGRQLGPKGSWGWGRACSRIVRVPAPGPPGARPDGLHREPGVLRGARACAPLRSAAPRDSAGPRAA